MTRFALLLIAMGALTAGCASARASGSGEADALACSASEAAMPSAEGRLLLFSTGAPDRETADIAEASPAELARGWSGRAPQSSALRNVRTAIQHSALDCAAVRSAAGDEGGVFTEADGMSKLKAAPLGRLPVYLYRISIAALSDDKTEAVVALAASSNQLGGGSELVALKRSAEGWVKVGRRRLLIG